MQNRDARETFVRELSACQRGLYAYIFAQLPDAAAADDVFQETNLQLWRKFDAGEEIRCLPALARELARFQVLTHRKKGIRSKLRFDADVLDLMVREMPEEDALLERRLGAMRDCLDALPPRGFELIQMRYLQEVSVQAIADKTGRSTHAVVQALYRARNALGQCIDRKLDEEDARS